MPPIRQGTALGPREIFYKLCIFFSMRRTVRKKNSTQNKMTLLQENACLFSGSPILSEMRFVSFGSTILNVVSLWRCFFHVFPHKIFPSEVWNHLVSLHLSSVFYSSLHNRWPIRYSSSASPPTDFLLPTFTENKAGNLFYLHSAAISLFFPLSLLLHLSKDHLPELLSQSLPSGESSVFWTDNSDFFLLLIFFPQNITTTCMKTH